MVRLGTRGFSVFVLGLCLAACDIVIPDRGGYISGVVDGGERIIIRYDGNLYQSGIGGEVYAGRAVDVDRSITKTEIQSEGEIFRTPYAYPYGGKSLNKSRYETKQHLTGKVEALLIGNLGSTLDCRLRYVQPGNPRGGGVGECVLTRRGMPRKVSVSW